MVSSSWLRKKKSTKSTEKIAISPTADVSVIVMMCDMIEPLKNLAFRSLFALGLLFALGSLLAMFFLSLFLEDCSRVFVLPVLICFFVKFFFCLDLYIGGSTAV